MTGMPLTRLSSEDAVRLLEMEDELHKRVISQDEAIKQVCQGGPPQPQRTERPEAADRRRSCSPARPASARRCWPRRWPSSCSATRTRSIQIDMCEYMEKHNVSRLIGAPPGYVGYEEGGQLTEKIRRRPYAVVLLDEIEKAHPDVFNMLLQIMEEGRLTDSFGRKVDFKNTILIMTTNVGAEVDRQRRRSASASTDEDDAATTR